MFNAKNLMIDIGETKVPCAVFGKGRKNLIMLPGIGDGLQTVEGKALPLALAYRKVAKDFRVYVMSRRKPLPENFGTKDMAEDIKICMDKLGIKTASFIGISMGGMIAQHFAAAYPERTEKLVLAVTAHRKTEEMKIIGDEWLELAKADDGVGLMKSSVENMYSDGYFKKNGWLTHITGRIAVPKSYERFIRMGFACLGHNTEEVLGKITAPTLVIGGTEDRTVGAKASEEIAAAIPNARLHMYEGLRHAVYDEAEDFNERVLDFLKE